MQCGTPQCSPRLELNPNRRQRVWAQKNLIHVCVFASCLCTCLCLWCVSVSGDRECARHGMPGAKKIPPHVGMRLERGHKLHHVTTRWKLPVPSRTEETRKEEKSMGNKKGLRAKATRFER